MLQSLKFASLRRSYLDSIRVQLGGGLLLSVALPYLTRFAFEMGRSEAAGLTNSLIGSTIAVVVGYVAFRRLSHYPGVRAAYHLLPIYLASYGAILSTFFFLRLDYSRLHFGVSFALCVVFYYTLYFKLRRQRRFRFGVVPCGRVDGLLSLNNVDWIVLQDDKTCPSDLDGIVADLRAEMPDEWERFLSDRALEGTLVLHAKQMHESLTGRVELEHLSENNLGSLSAGLFYGKFKRVIDMVLAIIAMPFLLLSLAIVGLLIKFDTRGSIFFLQQRMGFRGKPFTMIKLRTMHSAEHLSADERVAAITRDNDLRVTKVGRVLRRYRIDELPQVINILRGEMSWIGPRPEALALSKWYENELPFYPYRHIVRPGITGWAQVRLGHVAEVDQVMEKLHYDFYYIRNFSVWLDLLIVAATIRTVAGGFGAR